MISYMQSRTDARLEEKVDNNRYDQQDLISIKTKLDLPYYISSPQFERAYGSITINGTSYQYVKRRVYKDTLELLCLPNQAKTKMQSIKNELTTAFAEGQASTPKKHTTIKISLPDFFQPFKTFSAAYCTGINQVFVTGSSRVFEGYRLKLKRPPKPVSFSC